MMMDKQTPGFSHPMHTISKNQNQTADLFGELTNETNRRKNFQRAEKLLSEAEAAILKRAARILAKRSAEIRRKKQFRRWRRLCRIFGNPSNAGAATAMLTASMTWFPAKL
jgi:hypothetical protein